MEKESVRLGDICTTNMKSYSRNEIWQFINYLDTGNITQNIISKIQRIDTATDKVPSRAVRKVTINDIIISTVRPIQKHYGIINQLPDNFLVSSGFTVLSVDPSIADSFYIYYYITQDEIVKTLQTIAEQSMSTYPSIKPSDIEGLMVWLPPISEQRTIANTLKCLDKKIAINAKINDNLAA